MLGSFVQGLQGQGWLRGMQRGGPAGDRHASGTQRVGGTQASALCRYLWLRSSRLNSSSYAPAGRRSGQVAKRGVQIEEWVH